MIIRSLLVVTLMLAPVAFGQSTEERIRQLEEQVSLLQKQIEALQTAKPPAPAPAADPGSLLDVQVIEQPGTEAPAAQPATPAEGHHAAGPNPIPVYGTSSGKVFNPDIGIIGNFVGATGQTASSPTIAASPSFTLQESEASFQSIVDPYARADFFLAYGEEGVEVEEGYVTFTALPAALLLKTGNMRATFGRLNAFHNHTLPWVDRPIVMFNLLGGSTEDPDTGIKDAGLSVSRVFSLGPVFVEGTAEAFRGDSGTVFQAHRRSDIAAIGHLRSYLDITEAANFEAGASYGSGHNPLGSDFRTQLFGADLTYRWRPLERSIYRSFVARTELIWSRRQEPSETKRAFGLYASTEYQFARRWTGALRYDWSERAEDPDLRDRGVSAVLTFRPSEFSLLRWQYRRSQFAEARSANELLFQVLFVIGAHGAHPF